MVLTVVVREGCVDVKSWVNQYVTIREKQTHTHPAPLPPPRVYLSRTLSTFIYTVSFTVSSSPISSGSMVYKGSFSTKVTVFSMSSYKLKKNNFLHLRSGLGRLLSTYYCCLFSKLKIDGSERGETLCFPSQIEQSYRTGRDCQTLRSYLNFFSPS